MGDSLITSYFTLQSKLTKSYDLTSDTESEISGLDDESWDPRTPQNNEYPTFVAHDDALLDDPMESDIEADDIYILSIFKRATEELNTGPHMDPTYHPKQNKQKRKGKAQGHSEIYPDLYDSILRSFAGWPTKYVRGLNNDIMSKTGQTRNHGAKENLSQGNLDTFFFSPVLPINSGSPVPPIYVPSGSPSPEPCTHTALSQGVQCLPLNLSSTDQF
ncbi:hypothetical protein BS47DRAFT_1393930 [Hydnum rufescens UP504]|uniref:Uncharacterized protein n=1 Tax=Hydnum rufescens UP504 TaxID=1448309 RepID=A0A9P6AVN8_9AGAM|nr:hypothetical protein BS47DRAFT_1393930 [Hydnum rufescens UP504]